MSTETKEEPSTMHKLDQLAEMTDYIIVMKFEKGLIK